MKKLFRFLLPFLALPALANAGTVPSYPTATTIQQQDLFYLVTYPYNSLSDHKLTWQTLEQQMYASITGNISINSAGSVTIANGAVVNSMLATGIDPLKINPNTVSSTVFGYLAGVTSDIQTQLNNTINRVLTGYVSGAGTITSSDTILTAIQKLNGNIAALPPTTPAGSDTQIQYNNAGAFGASSDFLYDATNSLFSVGFSGSPYLKIDALGKTAKLGDYTGNFAGNYINVDFNSGQTALAGVIQFPGYSSGGTQMATIDSSGFLGTASIPSATPGGSNTQIQYNNAGVFDGSNAITISGGNPSFNSGVVNYSVGTQFNGSSYFEFSGAIVQHQNGASFDYNGGSSIIINGSTGTAHLDISYAGTTSGSIPAIIPALSGSSNFVMDTTTQTVINKTMSGASNTFTNLPLSASKIYNGSFSATGTATTTFTVTIGTTQSGTSYKVNVTPTSSLAAALFYVTNKTTTTFDVVFLAGLTGSVSFDWLITQ